MSAIVFCLFTFVYLYFFKADVMAVSQQILSHGATHYNRLVGAVLITAGLYVLQLGIFALTRLSKRAHALTYLPSMLVLVVLTDLQPVVRHSLGAWWWLIPLVVILWLLAVGITRAYQPYEPDNDTFGLFSRVMWVNLLTLVLMMFAVGLASHTPDVQQYRMRVESYLEAGDIEQALMTGKRSSQTDASLVMLRAYALSRSGAMGEQLFRYPIVGSSDQLLPVLHGQSSVLLSADSIYKHLGARPARPMRVRRYLQLLLQSGKDTAVVRDYILCAQLIDRQLDAFARTLPDYYAINDSLPKHYQEALTLYKHLRAHPVVDFSNPVMETDYKDLRALERQHPAERDRQRAVAEQYRETYWYYYEYGGAGE